MDSDISDLVDLPLEALLDQNGDGVTLGDTDGGINQEVDIRGGMPAMLAGTQHVHIAHPSYRGDR